MLAYLTNLTHLTLQSNLITEISPLSELTALTGLLLHSNQISDISPLENLTNLTSLSLYDNQISQISPLANLIDLTHLGLGGNQISDISPLAGLTSLTELSLHSNEISNISPLVDNAGIGEGDHVDLRYNHLDLTPGSQAMDDIQALQARGVEVHYDPQSEIPYALTISSTAGGSVTTPGEGVFVYPHGEVVDLVATPAGGYQFINWTGNVGNIANTSAASTNITMNDDYSITANFALMPVCATLSPTTRQYDLANPADANTTITWNDATDIVSIYDGTIYLTAGTHYTLVGSTLTILHDPYLEGKLTAAGQSVTLAISFDVCSSSTFTITAIQT